MSDRVHDLLFPHSGDQKELKPQSLLVVTGSEESVEFVLLINLRFLLRVPWAIRLLDQPTNAIRLKERHHVGELVPATAGGLIFVIAEKRCEFQEVSTLDVFEKLFGTGLRKII